MMLTHMILHLKPKRSEQEADREEVAEGECQIKMLLWMMIKVIWLKDCSLRKPNQYLIAQLQHQTSSSSINLGYKLMSFRVYSK